MLCFDTVSCGKFPTASRRNPVLTIWLKALRAAIQKSAHGTEHRPLQGFILAQIKSGYVPIGLLSCLAIIAVNSFISGETILNFQLLPCTLSPNIPNSARLFELTLTGLNFFLF